MEFPQEIQHFLEIRRWGIISRRDAEAQRRCGVKISMFAQIHLMRIRVSMLPALVVTSISSDGSEAFPSASNAVTTAT